MGISRTGTITTSLPRADNARRSLSWFALALQAKFSIPIAPISGVRPGRLLAAATRRGRRAAENFGNSKDRIGRCPGPCCHHTIRVSAAQCPHSVRYMPRWRWFLRIVEWILGPPLAVGTFAYSIWGPRWPTAPNFLDMQSWPAHHLAPGAQLAPHAGYKILFPGKLRL